MNMRELEEHIQNKTPFVVYGEIVRFEPARDGSDPHGWYRASIAKGEIPVSVQNEAEFWREQKKLIWKNDDLIRKIEQLEKANATLKAELARAIELKDGETYDWDLLGRVQERDAWRTEAIAARELLSMSMEQIYSNHGGDIYCSVCHKAWPIHTEKCTYHSVKNAYLSARVKDGE